MEAYLERGKGSVGGWFYTHVVRMLLPGSPPTSAGLIANSVQQL